MDEDRLVRWPRRGDRYGSACHVKCMSLYKEIERRIIPSRCGTKSMTGDNGELRTSMSKREEGRGEE